MDFWIPFILFSVSFLFKLTVVIENRTFPLIFDEFKYEKMSRLLLLNRGYHSVQYPLFYPLSLMPAYLFGEHYYVAMKVLNSFYSSFVPVFTYMICRLYMDEKPGGICAAFSAVIPFQYITPMCLMSENLWFPMLLLAIYLVLRKHKRELLGDAALGITLGLLFMTRHITLVIIPVFALVWIMKQKELGKSWKLILRRGFLVSALLCLAYSPWVYNGIKGGYSLKKIIGFTIASKTNPEQLTLSRLITSAGYYLGYFALITAPVLGLAVKSIRALDIGRTKIFSAYNQLWVTVCGLAGAIFVAVTRHSWRAYYNYPEFTKIKGRYVIYFTVLFVILGAVVMFHTNPRFKHRWINIITTWLLPAGAIALAWLVIVKQAWHPIPGGKNAKNTFLLLTELWGAAPYLDAVHRNNETAKQTSQRYAAEMSETLAELYTGKKLYVLAENVPSEKILLHAPVFYHLDKVVVTTDREAVKSDSYYVLTDQREKYRNAEKRLVASYHWEDKEYWMLEVSKKQPSIQGAVSLPDEAFLLWKAA